MYLIVQVLRGSTHLTQKLSANAYVCRWRLPPHLRKNYSKMGKCVSKNSNGSTRTRRPSDVRRCNVAVNIRKRHDGLLSIVDIDFGLLDYLCGMNVLTYEQKTRIEELATPPEKIRQLLKDVVDMSPDRQELFLEALIANEQSHVVNYIRGLVHCGATEEDWPIYISSVKEKNLFKFVPTE